MTEIQSRPRRFATTCWSVVLQARQTESPEAARALEELCEVYWFPVYAFIRRQTSQPEESQDLTQAFFVHVLSRSFLKDVDERNGKFRSWLLASVRNFLSNEADRAAAVKRGGRIQFRSLDWHSGEQRFQQAVSEAPSAERLFERQWSLVLLAEVLKRLGQEMKSSDQSAVFDALSDCLTTDRDSFRYDHAAQQLGVSIETARTAAHRLRKRYRQLLRAEIRETVSSEAEVDDEVQRLFRSLTG